jgi:hypothetical protein
MELPLPVIDHVLRFNALAGLLFSDSLKLRTESEPNLLFLE